MQKVLDILEQHIQWIALGLGGLFVLFMVWTYVINPPAQVQVGSEMLGPGEVDPHTNETVAQELNAAINSGGKIAGGEVPKYVAVFQQRMELQDAKPIQFAGPWKTYTTDVELPELGPDGRPLTPQEIQQRQEIVGDPGAQGEKIAALPALPVPEPTPDPKYGRSVVLMPVAGQPPPPMPQPGQPVVGGVDKDWVTQLFEIDMAKMAAAFKKVGITAPPLPDPWAKTLFLQVEMERQEMQADGTWSEAKIIPPLETWRQNQPPPPFPDNAANRAAQGAYLAWANTNTPDILQPAFYVTVPQKGDQWTKPGPEVVVEQVFDPMQWIDARDLGGLTPEQRKMVLDARRERTRLQNEEKNRNRPTGPRPGGRTPGDIPMEDEMMYAPARGERFHAAPPRPPARPPMYPGRPPYGRQPYPGAYPSDMMEMEGDYMGGGYGMAGVEQGLPQPGVDYPNGEFMPGDTTAQWAGKKIETWAHDATVEPGKQYRYRLRYKVKNPIFAAFNAAQNPELAGQFAIVSEWSEWTTPVQIPEMVNFFVASSKAPNANTVRFDVYTWHEGQTRQETFAVGPGDLVGGQRNGIDFSTDWTVVDFREDPRQQNEYQIMLVNNEDGRIVVRSYRADSNDALYKGLKEQIKLADEAAAAQAAVNGGAGVPLR